MRRREPTPIPEHLTNPDYTGMLEALLEHRGSVGNTFRRLYQYSMGNIAFLMYQGVTPQPVATFDRWKEVDRHVKRGSSAKYILRPINVKLKDELDEDGNPKTIKRFKPVKSVFALEDTEGEPLPEVELPDWSQARALGVLGIELMDYTSYEVNTAGYSVGNRVAINPTAAHPEDTFFHECAHIVCGHTTPEALALYQQHRGTYELEAEAAAHLVQREIGIMTPEVAALNSSYIRNWARGERPSDRSVKTIFRATDTIVSAGRPDATKEAEQCG